MAQLIVRNVPDDVKERLKRRAKRHGHSLEAEVRDILSQATEPQALPADRRDWTKAFAERIRATGVTSDDVDALKESIAELRRDWRDRDVIGKR